MKIDHNKYVDIDKVVDYLGEEIATKLPAIHALTGCDTTSSFFGTGKVRLIKWSESLELYSTSLVPRRYVLFYGLRGLCVGRVDQFEMKSSLRDIFYEEDSYLDTPSIIKKNKQTAKLKNSVFQLLFI